MSINSGEKSLLNCRCLSTDASRLGWRCTVGLGYTVDLTIDELSGDCFWDAELDDLELSWVDIIMPSTLEL